MNSSKSFALITAQIALMILCVMPSLAIAAPETPEEWNAGRDLRANEKPDQPALGSTETLNPNGEIPQWSYGWREAVGGLGLTLFTVAEHVNSFNGNESFEGWETPPQNLGKPYVLANVGPVQQLAIDELLVHPGVESERKYVVVRWTAPRNARYDIITRWRDFDVMAGDGVDAHIVLNGASVFDTIVPDGGTTNNFHRLSLVVGDILDFVIGPNQDLALHDATAFKAVIAPEPASATIAGLAVVAYLCRLRSRFKA